MTDKRVIEVIDKTTGKKLANVELLEEQDADIHVHIVIKDKKKKEH